MCTAVLLASLLMLASSRDLSAQELSAEHRVLLREGFRLVEEMKDRWADWTTAPDAVLLVDADSEFLVGHPQPTDDFRATTSEPIEGRPVLWRERVMPPGLLATFPAVGGVPTVVIGTPEATGLNPTRWILTMLHEHFHQLQMSRPWYYGGVDSLDLSGGDDTGMWMLNYPFPYSEPSVREAVSRLGRTARDLAETARGGSVSVAAVRDYLEVRAALERSTQPDDYRYLSFQLWQEGVARYAELDAAVHAAETFGVSEEFRSLPDFVPFDEAAYTLWNEIRTGVDQDPSESARVYFYGLGALEATILEAARPGWRDRYSTEPFDVARYWADSR